MLEGVYQMTTQELSRVLNSGNDSLASFPSDVIGGSREEPTRMMILAGKAWLDNHPGIVPDFLLMPGAMLQTRNDAAKELLEAILAVAPAIIIEVDGKEQKSYDEAMVQTAVNHCSFIRNWTWRGYIARMTPVKHACTCSGVEPYNINCAAHGHLVPRGPLLK